MKEASTRAAFAGTPLQVYIVPSRNFDVYFSSLLLLSLLVRTYSSPSFPLPLKAYINVSLNYSDNVEN